MWINPNTGKGWSDREEEVITVLQKEFGDRLSAIQAMRRRRLDDLKGAIQVSEHKFVAAKKEKKVSRLATSTAKTWFEIKEKQKYSHQRKQNKELNEEKINSLQDTVTSLESEQFENNVPQDTEVAETVADHANVIEEVIENEPLIRRGRKRRFSSDAERVAVHKARKEFLIGKQDGKCCYCERNFGSWIRKGVDGVL